MAVPGVGRTVDKPLGGMSRPEVFQSKFLPLAINISTIKRPSERLNNEQYQLRIASRYSNTEQHKIVYFVQSVGPFGSGSQRLNCFVCVECLWMV